MKYGSTLFHLPKRNILISSIISSMVTLFVITMLFMILKVFNLDVMKDHLNQKFVLSVMMIFIWGITFYITHFNKKEMSILRASLRVHFILLLLAHTVALFYIVMQVNMIFIEAMNWIYFYNMQFILSFVVIYAIYILVY
ncbi:LTA synthase family protein, partial [Bacillus thuringiensis]